MNDTNTTTAVLHLFVIDLSTDGWASEYGCHFIVAAKDERCARMIVDHEVVDDFGNDGYTMECRDVGFAHREDPGLVSGFTT